MIQATRQPITVDVIAQYGDGDRWELIDGVIDMEPTSSHPKSL